MITDSFLNEEILPHLRIRTPACGDKSFLLVWFERQVETHIEDLWSVSPSEAFLLHTVLQDIIALKLKDRIPEIALHGCAPLPRPERELRAALSPLGLHLLPAGQLNRVYATITFHPWKGGCPNCALETSCPKNLRRKNRDVRLLVNKNHDSSKGCRTKELFVPETGCGSVSNTIR